MAIYLPEDPRSRALEQFGANFAGRAVDVASKKTLKSMFQDVLDAGGSPLTAMQRIWHLDPDLSEKLLGQETKRRGNETLRKMILQYSPELGQMLGESDDVVSAFQTAIELDDMKRNWYNAQTGRMNAIPQPQQITPKWDTVKDGGSSTGYSYRNLNDPSGTLIPNAPAPKSSGVTVNVGDLKPASAQERTDIADARTSRDSLTNLQGLFDAAYVGPLAGRVGKVRDIFGGNPQAQSEFNAATAAFKNSIIKQITGAQMSEPEAKRILKQIPEVTDPPSVWQAKAKQSIDNINRMEKRRLEILEQSGLRVPQSKTTISIKNMSDEELEKALRGE